MPDIVESGVVLLVGIGLICPPLIPRRARKVEGIARLRVAPVIEIGREHIT